VHEIVLGIVQGLTEFLPISSSGHLVLVPGMLGWEEPPLGLTVMLHLGTLVALLIYFRNEIIGLILGVLGRGPDAAASRRIVRFLIVGTIPAGIVGLAFGALLFAGALADGGEAVWVGLLLGPLCAALGWLAVGGLVERVRTRLEPEQAALLTAYADGAALLLAAVAVFVPPLALLAIPAFILLLVGGRRREGEKYAGLRILR